MNNPWPLFGAFTLVLILWLVTGSREVTAGYVIAWVIGLIVVIIASVVDGHRPSE